MAKALNKIISLLKVRVRPLNLITIQDRVRAIQRDASHDGEAKAKLIQALYSRPLKSTRGAAGSSSVGGGATKRTAADAPPCAHYACECVVVSGAARVTSSFLFFSQPSARTRPFMMPSLQLSHLAFVDLIRAPNAAR
jgi:hypothetical protein